MKKLIMAILGLGLIAITGLSFYVSQIDWNKHKGKISNYLLDISGKKVVFNGPVSLSLFPSPYFTADDVLVFSAVNKDLEKPLMRIESVVANLSFSSLLGGNFDVRMMSLVNPNILVQKNDKGINWFDKAQTKSDTEMSNVNISLDSVFLDNAKMTIIDETRDVNIELDNLKAEIVADSINGPYRIDGSYIKDNNPEGFAISIGSISESFATNLNFVLSQPVSESYLRFDGTFLLSNEAMNGNLILESQKFKTFYDSIVTGSDIGGYFDKKLEASMELKVSQSQVELANVILKYGKTMGAGSIVIPLHKKSYIIDDNEKQETREVSVKFDMTEFELTPLVTWFKDFIKSQQKDNSIYFPQYPYDLNINLSALKAEYNNQTIKDFGIKLNLNDNVWHLESVEGIFPGNTDVKMSGRVFSVEDVFSYVSSVDIQTDNLKKLLEWVGIKVNPIAAATYLKSSFKAAIVGDINKVKIAPFSFNIDNTILNGSFGVKKGTPSQYALELKSNSVNLDNYLPKLFDGEDKKLIPVLKEQWKKMAWLNDINADIRLNSDLLIYQNTSFGKVTLNSKIQNGIFNVEKFTIGDFLNSNMNISGEIRGFANTPQLSNVNYNFNTKNLQNWLQILGVNQTKFDAKYFQPFSSTGNVSLNNSRVWLKMDTQAGASGISYNGRIVEKNGGYTYSGELQMRADEATKFLQALHSQYIPQSDGLGRMGLKSQIIGENKKFKLSDLNFNVGANTFQGTLGANISQDVPYWVANLKINRFEANRFMPKGEGKHNFFADGSSARGVDLWKKPLFSSNPFDFESLRKVNWVSKLAINELLLGDNLLKNVSMGFDNKNSKLVLSDMQADYNDGSVSADLKYDYEQAPKLSGKINITNQNVYDFNLVGNTYGIKSGTAELAVNMDTSATSPKDIFDNFSGEAFISISNPVVNGIDLYSIISDLSDRKHSDGLQTSLSGNLQKGETAFNTISGKINFSGGEWNINNMLMSANMARINVKSTGNLANWNMDSEFNVQLLEPENVNPFIFSLKGDVASPVLDVDVVAITKALDDYQEKIVADKKAAQMAYENDLLTKMEVQRAVLQDVREDFEAFVEKEYEVILTNMVNDQYKKELEALKDDINQQKSNFNNVDELLVDRDIKEEYPQYIATITEEAKEVLSKLKAKVYDVYVKDMKELIASNVVEIQKEMAIKDRIMQDCLDKKDSQIQRLNKIDTDFRFGTDKVYHQLAKQIDGKINEFNQAVQNVARYKMVAETENEVNELKKYAEESSDVLATIREIQDIVADDIERYLTYMEETIAVEELHYAERLAAEEKAKKIEENIGTISSPATGKVQTIIRGIDDIENSENNVVDMNALNDVVTDELEINLLRNEDDISNVSGTISKK